MGFFGVFFFGGGGCVKREASEGEQLFIATLTELTCFMDIPQT